MRGEVTMPQLGDANELAHHGELIALLKTRVGPLLFKGFPTSVEVANSIVHARAYPATAVVRVTSLDSASKTTSA
ncbi:hypothetical protein C5O80_12570 [Burkholderia sp. SRS-46]|nr:hypothetical protein C5O80_12570 [Burkholderia sp. SRS-46]